MTGTLWRASARHLLRHPAQLLLTVLGLALGVATVTAIDLAARSAERALRLSVETVNGRATHQILGGPTGLDEALYALLRTQDLGVELAPVVDGYGEISGRSVLVLGIDVLADSRVREYSALPGGASIGSLRQWMNEPGMTLASRATVAALGLEYRRTISPPHCRHRAPGETVRDSRGSPGTRQCPDRRHRDGAGMV